MFRLRLVHAPEANLSLRGLLEQIAFEANRAGADAAVVDGEFPVGEDIVYIVVAHEYFMTRPPQSWPSIDQLSRTIALTVEAAESCWFEASAEQARRCAMTMDISHSSTAELRRRGLRVLPFQLGHSDYIDHWRGADDPREIDICYLGSSDGQRNALLASYSRWWSDAKVSLLTPSAARQTCAGESYLVGADKYSLLGRSRMLLNLHRPPTHSLEWVKVLEAMANGAVVISEHSQDCWPLVVGEHFVAAHPDTLGLLTRRLLDDEARLRDIRSAAYDFIRSEMPLARSVADLLTVCRDLVEQPITPTAHAVPVSSRRTPPFPWEVLNTGPVAQLGAEVSRLRRRVRDLEARQAQIQGEGGYLGDATTPSLQTPAYEGAEPLISVLVPVFDKVDHAATALDSIVACGRDDVEILIVDDFSCDGSLELLTRWIRDHPQVPACLLVRRTNGGAARARNSLLRRARGEFAFTLDADNGVYPSALDALAGALLRQPDSAYAYGPIEVRRHGRPVGLVSMRPLDRDEIRYGNYVDSMAMFRTSSLRAAGGWNEAMHTWEDYELWLRLLEAGVSGTFVPQVHSWYGLHDGTLRTAADLELTGLWSQLRAAAPTVLADRRPPA